MDIQSDTIGNVQDTMSDLNSLELFGTKFPEDPQKRKPLRNAEGDLDYVQLFMVILIGFFALATVYIIYNTYIEDNPPVVFHQSIITKKSAAPGGHVEWLVDFEKFTTAAPDRRRFWINGVSTEVPEPDDPPSNDPGRYKFLIKADVPLELLPGEDYYIVQTFTYQVNHLAERSVTDKIGPFTIVEKE